MPAMTRCGLACAFVPLLAVATARAQDTVRVKADGKPVWGENVRLVEEVSIGRVDGPPEYAFGRIALIATDAGGGFYTFDASDVQIRRYDGKGTHLSNVGRKGGGPGEYQYVAAMAVTRDALLIVYDPNNARVSYFQPDGKLRRSFPLTRAGFYGNGFIIDNAERIYLSVPLPGGPDEGAGSRQQFLRYRGDQLIDSLLLPPPQPASQAFVLSTSDGMRWNFADFGLVSPYWGGGSVSARAGAYRFVVDTGRGTVRVVERAARAVALGNEEREEWTAFADFMQRTRPPHRAYTIPRTKPYIRSLTSDHLGRVWVEVYVAAEKRTNIPPRPPERGPLVTWRERTTYDVFAPTGEFLGRVALPAESVLMTVRNDRLWVRAKGPGDEDRIAVYRIQRD